VTLASDPREVISRVYSSFSTRRHGHKGEQVAAWMQLQKDLADNAGSIVPSFTSLKDLTATLMDIEAMLKGKQGDAGESPAEYLAKWLSDDKGGKAVTQ
jgi:hypothetical protein